MNLRFSFNTTILLQTWIENCNFKETKNSDLEKELTTNPSYK